MSRADPIVVTGAAGFVGSWLVPELVKGGARVIGIRKPGVPSPTLDCEWTDADLRDRAETWAALREARPRAVVHLAAMAVPGDAADDPIEALRMNYVAVDHLIGALCALAPEARLLLVSTGQAYGLRSADAPPAREGDRLLPPNLYAATKVAAEQRGRLACERDGLDVVRVRPFNHTGPGRPDAYAEASFARQLAELERGDAEPVVRVGNLEGLRDFSDVRDVVHAYALLLERGVSGEVYNVCSGRAHSLRSLLDSLVASSKLDVRIEVDPERYRASAPDRVASLGDPTRIRALGWQPTHELEATLEALLDDWRSRV